MSLVGAIGAGLSLVGNFMSASAQQRMVNEQTQASMRAENAREQQMQLEASRQRRSAIREAILARATSLSVGVAQGAQHGSGVAAGMGQAIAMGQEQQQQTTSAEILGGRVFAANRDFFRATQRGQRGMALGQGIASLGGMMTSNAGTINRVGTYLTGQNFERGFA